MDLGLNGKRALVTGGSKGIGRAIVETLIADGASVSFCARTESDVLAAVQDLRAAGATVYGASLDVRDEAAFNAWVDKSAELLGGIDILISNVTTRIYSKGEAMWRDCFDVDFLQHVRVVNACLPHLEQAKGGSVTIISSIASVLTHLPPGEEGYGAMKAALINYVGQMGATQARKSIRFNAVSPGPVDFPGGFWDQVRQKSPAMFERAASLAPLGRHATAQEVAAAAVFLASPKASFITGANLRVDGGGIKSANF